MPERPPIFCFGPFEFDSYSGELRKFDHRIRLQGNSVKVLEAILLVPGELVTREELQQKIWPADTFVDFEHGLNSAVAKLRQALSDAAASPKYVETLERRGYRFIAEVTIKERPLAFAAAAASHGTSVPVSPVSASPAVTVETPSPIGSHWRFAALIAFAVLVLIAA